VLQFSDLIKKNSGWSNLRAKTEQKASTGEIFTPDWKYEIKDKGVTILRYTGNRHEVEIPSDIDGEDVVAIDSGFPARGRGLPGRGRAPLNSVTVSGPLKDGRAVCRHHRRGLWWSRNW